MAKESKNSRQKIRCTSCGKEIKKSRKSKKQKCPYCMEEVT